LRSNFDSPLTIVNGDVKAQGELEWDPGEEQALVSVSIFQKQHTVAGMATSHNPFDKKSSKQTWTLDIKPGYENTSFEPGLANAIGIVCAMSDQQVRVFLWSQEVKLKA
jgi:hypothetical protein